MIKIAKEGEHGFRGVASYTIFNPNDPTRGHQTIITHGENVRSVQHCNGAVDKLINNYWVREND